MQVNDPPKSSQSMKSSGYLGIHNLDPGEVIIENEESDGVTGKEIVSYHHNLWQFDI